MDVYEINCTASEGLKPRREASEVTPVPVKPSDLDMKVGHMECNAVKLSLTPFLHLGLLK